MASRSEKTLLIALSGGELGQSSPIKRGFAKGITLVTWLGYLDGSIGFLLVVSECFCGLCCCSQGSWLPRTGFSATRQSWGEEWVVLDRNMPGTPKLEIATASGASDHFHYIVTNIHYQVNAHPRL